MIDVVIAHKSHKVRSGLAIKISGSDNLNVCARVKDASEFFEEVENSDPDVVLLGTMFDDVSGLDLLDRLMVSDPKPVLIIQDQEDQETVKSFSYGAIDFISTDQSREDIEGLIRLASEVDDFTWRRIDDKPPEPPLDTDKAIAIGASTGGPGSVETIISNMPEDLPAPILVSQHMSKGYIDRFADRLNELAELRVKKAEHDEIIEEGSAYISPANKDMLVVEDDQKACIKLEEPSRDESPSIDRLFTSVYETYGSQVVAAVLSGMGKDGAVGSRYISSVGGTLIVQDEQTSAVYGIGSHVEEQGDADRILPVEKIPRAIVRCL